MDEDVLVFDDLVQPSPAAVVDDGKDPDDVYFDHTLMCSDSLGIAGVTPFSFVHERAPGPTTPTLPVHSPPAATLIEMPIVRKLNAGAVRLLGSLSNAIVFAGDRKWLRWTFQMNMQRIFVIATVVIGFTRVVSGVYGLYLCVASAVSLFVIMCSLLQQALQSFTHALSSQENSVITRETQSKNSLQSARPDSVQMAPVALVAPLRAIATGMGLLACVGVGSERAAWICVHIASALGIITSVHEVVVAGRPVTMWLVFRLVDSSALSFMHATRLYESLFFAFIPVVLILMFLLYALALQISAGPDIIDTVCAFATRNKDAFARFCLIVSAAMLMVRIQSDQHQVLTALDCVTGMISWIATKVSFAIGCVLHPVQSISGFIRAIASGSWSAICFAIDIAMLIFDPNMSDIFDIIIRWAPSGSSSSEAMAIFVAFAHSVIVDVSLWWALDTVVRNQSAIFQPPKSVT